MTAVEEIEKRYAGFFEELGYGCHASFKHLLDQIALAITTATSDDVDLLAKLYTLKSARTSVEVVTKYYRRFLPPTIVNNLWADLTFLLERAEEVAVDV